MNTLNDAYRAVNESQVLDLAFEYDKPDGKNCRWMGFTHRRYPNARYTVQFQFGINAREIWSNGIWLDKNADKDIHLPIQSRVRSYEVVMNLHALGYRSVNGLQTPHDLSLSLSSPLNRSILLL